MQLAREFCRASLIRALIPFMRAPPSWSKHLPEAPPHNIITLAIRFQYYEFGEDTDIQTIAAHLEMRKLNLMTTERDCWGIVLTLSSHLISWSKSKVKKKDLPTRTTPPPPHPAHSHLSSVAYPKGIKAIVTVLEVAEYSRIPVYRMSCKTFFPLASCSFCYSLRIG